MSLYVAGDIQLARSRRYDVYRQTARELREAIPSGARVLASPVWWFAMRSDVQFLDEHLVTIPGSNQWWQGVPTEGFLATALAHAVIAATP